MNRAPEMRERRPLLDRRVVPQLAFAPRIDVRLHHTLARLDVPGEPVAEIYRRLCAEARALRLFRPSYEHVRRLVVALRRLRQARRRPRRDTAVVLFQLADDVRPPGDLVAHPRHAWPTIPP